MTSKRFQRHQRSLRNKQLLAIVITLLFSCLVAVGTSPAAEEPVVSLDLDRTPMSEVAHLVFAQTGYTTEYAQTLHNKTFSGDFHSIKITAFYRRILKKDNVFITIFPQERMIRVQDAGKTVAAHPSSPTQPKQQEQGYSYQEQIKPKRDKLETEAKQPQSTSMNTKYGEIDELPPTSPPKKANNEDHLIDSQTGKPWAIAEELLSN